MKERVRGSAGELKTMILFNRTETLLKRRQLRKDQTDAERLLWSRLRGKALGLKFFRQYGIGSYIADFYSPAVKLVVELDGGQHYTEDGLAYDKVREEYMAAVGVKTVRFSNVEVLTDLDGVLHSIMGEVEGRSL